MPIRRRSTRSTCATSFALVIRARFAVIGEYLAALKDPALAELAYQRIAPLDQRCGHLGLMGLCWLGPMARCLGHLAAATGRLVAVNEHFATALETARRMRARAWVARIALEWVEVLQRLGSCVPGTALLLDEAASAGQRAWHARSRRTASRSAAPMRRATPRRNREAPSGRPRRTARGRIFRLTRDGEVWLCECDSAGLPAARQSRACRCWRDLCPLRARRFTCSISWAPARRRAAGLRRFRRNAG